MCCCHFSSVGLLWYEYVWLLLACFIFHYQPYDFGPLKRPLFCCTVFTLFPLCFSFFIFNDPFDFIWLRKHEMHYTNIKFNGCYAFRKSTHRKEKEETHFVFHLNDIAFSGMGMECVLFLCVHNEMWKMENLLAFFSLSCCIGYWYCWHYAFKSVYYLRYSIGSCF